MRVHVCQCIATQNMFGQHKTSLSKHYTPQCTYIHTSHHASSELASNKVSMGMYTALLFIFHRGGGGRGIGGGGRGMGGANWATFLVTSYTWLSMTPLSFRLLTVILNHVHTVCLCVYIFG